MEAFPPQLGARPPLSEAAPAKMVPTLGCDDNTPGEKARAPLGVHRTSRPAVETKAVRSEVAAVICPAPLAHRSSALSGCDALRPPKSSSYRSTAAAKELALRVTRTMRTPATLALAERLELALARSSVSDSK